MANTRAIPTELWPSLRREAQLVAARDPAFGQALAAAILDHPDLGSVVAHQIGTRLGKTAAERARFASVAREAHAAAPALVEAASRDLGAIAAHDPATTALLPPLLNYKGYVALQAFRVAHWLWRNERFDLALLLQAESSTSLQVSIHPSATIGTSVFLDHATGIVIGAFAAIGDDVTILQNVTIGDFAKIGAGALVTADVPAGCTAVGAPARLANCPQQPMSSAATPLDAR